MAIERDSYWARKAAMGRRRFLAAGGSAAAGLAAFGLAGCGDDDDKKTATATAKASASAAPSGSASAAASPSAAPKATGFLGTIPENPPDPIQVKDFKSGGSINRITDRPLGFDTVGVGGTSNTGQTIGPVYNKLVRYSNRANMKSVMNPDIEGELAATWEQPDENTVIFQLEPNIKWQNVAPLNGRPFTIDDLKYHFERGKTHQKSAYKAYYEIVRSAEDVGGGKVRLNLSKAFLPIIPHLTFIAFMVLPKEMGEQANLQTAVGTGAFIMTRATPNVGVEYKRNPDYFKKDSAGKQLPYLDNYTLSIVADPAARLALAESGKADSVYQQSTPINFDNVEGIAGRNKSLGFTVNGQVNPFFSVLGKYGQAPWNDVRVRRALNMLMDRETIMKQVFKGLSHVGPFVPWPAAFDKEPQVADLGANYKYSPKDAKALLSAAGINNPEWSLDWYESQANETILTIFQQSCAEAGVKINLIKSPDITAHGSKTLAKSWKDLILRAKSADYIDAQATQLYLQPGAAVNVSDTNDADLNGLYTKLETAKGDARKVATKAIWDRHLDQIYEVMLPQPYDLFWWNTRMHNWRNQAMSGNVGIGESNMEHTWVAS